MGGRDATMVLLDENGIRCDGRKIDEPRRIMIKAGGLKNADGSAYIKLQIPLFLMLTMKKTKQVKQICQLDICQVLRKLPYYN